MKGRNSATLIRQIDDILQYAESKRLTLFGAGGGHHGPPLRFLFFIEKTAKANRIKSLCKFVESHCAINAKNFFAKYYMVYLKNRMMSPVISQKSENRFF